MGDNGNGNYRFKKGEKVLCNTGDKKWEPCIIIGHDYWEDHFDEPAAYQAKKIRNGRLIYVPFDEPSLVREFVTEPIEKLICAIKYDEYDEIVQIINEYDIEIVLKVKEILTNGAIFGNINALSIYEDEDTGNIDFNMELDDSGRNIVLIAMMKRQFDFIITLGEQKEGFYQRNMCKFFSHSDKHGHNILHYAVIVNAEEFLMHFFCDDEDSIAGSIASNCFSSYIFMRYPLPTIFQKVSNKGKTAYDLAVDLKRANLVKILRDFAQQAIVENLLSRIDYSIVISPQSQDGFSEWEDNLARNGIDISTIQLSKGNAARLQKSGFACGYGAKLDELKWLIEKWKLDYHFPPNDSYDWYDRYPLSLAFLRRHGLHPPSLVHAAVIGPLNHQYWVDPCNVEKYLVEFNAETFSDLLRLVFNTLFEKGGLEWTHPTIKSLILSPTSCRNTTSGEYEYLLLPGEKLQEAYPYYDYIDGIVRRIDGVKVSERIALLSYLLDELKLPPPPLSSLVSLGQLHLLQWFFSRSDPMACLCSDPQLMALRDSTEFLRGSDEKMPIAAILCAYATGLGEVATMEWLLWHFPISDFRFYGFTYLHIAIMRKHTACVLWLIQFFPYMLTWKADNGLNAFHLAVSAGNVFVTLKLLESTNKIPGINQLWEDDAAGKSVFSYLRDSEVPEIKAYLASNATINDIDSLVTVLTVDEKISLQSITMLMIAVNFFAIMEEELTYHNLFNAVQNLPEYLMEHAEYANSCKNQIHCSTGTQYDANPSSNWGSSSVGGAVCEVVTKCIDIGRMDIFCLILAEIQDSDVISVADKEGLYSIMIIYAKYVDNVSAVTVIEEYLDNLEGNTTDSKIWKDRWKELNKELYVAFVDLDLKSILEVLEKQRLWLLSTPDNNTTGDKSLFEGNSYIYVNGEPLTPLSYAMRSNNDEVVHWLVSFPTLRLHTLMPELIDAVLDIGNVKYLKMVLDSEWLYLPEKVSAINSYDSILRCLNSYDGVNGLSIFQFLVRRVVDQGNDINTFFYGESGVYPMAVFHIFHSKYNNVQAAFSALEWIISQRYLDLNLYADSNDGVIAFLLKNVTRNIFENTSAEFQTGVNYSMMLLDLFKKHGIDFIQHARVVKSVFEEMLHHNVERELTSRFFLKVVLHVVEIFQLDIQKFDFLYVNSNAKITSEEGEYVPLHGLDRLKDCPDASTLRVQLQTIRDAQRARFSLLNRIKNNESIISIQNALVENNPSMLTVQDSEGRGLLHHAAVLGRVDVLDLLSKFNVDLKTKDNLGRGVVSLAEAAGELSFARRFRQLLSVQLVSEFCTRRWPSYVFLRDIRSRLKLKNLAATSIQSRIRRHQVFRRYCSYLRGIKGSWARFKQKWALGKN